MLLWDGRVLWLWRTDGRFSRELVETSDFTEGASGCGRGLDRSENESDKGKT